MPTGDEIKDTFNFATGGIVNSRPFLIYECFEEIDTLRFYMNNQDKKVIKELADIKELIYKLHHTIESVK